MQVVMDTAEKHGDKRGFKLRLFCEINRNVKTVDEESVRATIQQLATAMENDPEMPELMKKGIIKMNDAIKDAKASKIVDTIIAEQKKVGYDVPNPFVNKILQNSKFDGKTKPFETTMASMDSLKAILENETAKDIEIYGSVMLLTTLFVLLLTGRKEE